MYCHMCGNQLPDNAPFCTNCGASMQPSSAGAAGPQQPAAPAQPYSQPPVYPGNYLPAAGYPPAQTAYPASPGYEYPAQPPYPYPPTPPPPAGQYPHPSQAQAPAGYPAPQQPPAPPVPPAPQQPPAPPMAAPQPAPEEALHTAPPAPVYQQPAPMPPPAAPSYSMPPPPVAPPSLTASMPDYRGKNRKNLKTGTDVFAGIVFLALGLIALCLFGFYAATLAAGGGMDGLFPLLNKANESTVGATVLSVGNLLGLVAGLLITVAGIMSLAVGKGKKPAYTAIVIMLFTILCDVIYLGLTYHWDLQHEPLLTVLARSGVIYAFEVLFVLLPTVILPFKKLAKKRLIASVAEAAKQAVAEGAGEPADAHAPVLTGDKAHDRQAVKAAKAQAKADRDAARAAEKQAKADGKAAHAAEKQLNAEDAVEKAADKFASAAEDAGAAAEIAEEKRNLAQQISENVQESPTVQLPIPPLPESASTMEAAETAEAQPEAAAVSGPSPADETPTPASQASDE